MRGPVPFGRWGAIEHRTAGGAEVHMALRQDSRFEALMVRMRNEMANLMHTAVLERATLVHYTPPMPVDDAGQALPSRTPADHAGRRGATGRQCERILLNGHRAGPGTPHARSRDLSDLGHPRATYGRQRRMPKARGLRLGEPMQCLCV